MEVRAARGHRAGAPRPLPASSWHLASPALATIRVACQAPGHTVPATGVRRVLASHVLLVAARDAHLPRTSAAPVRASARTRLEYEGKAALTLRARARAPSARRAAIARVLSHLTRRRHPTQEARETVAKVMDEAAAHVVARIRWRSGSDGETAQSMTSQRLGQNSAKRIRRCGLRLGRRRSGKSPRPGRRNRKPARRRIGSHCRMPSALLSKPVWRVR